MSLGDKVIVTMDVGTGTRDYPITARKAGRKVEIQVGRQFTEVNEVTRGGKTVVATAHFMNSRIVALVEHSAAEETP